MTNAATISGLSSQPAFSAYATAIQTVSVNTFTKVVLNAKDFDTASAFDATTNYRFTPLVAGYYQINATIFYNANSTSGLGYIAIYKNGSNYKTSAGSFQANGYMPLNISSVVYFNGSTDYIELYTYQNSSLSANTQATSSGGNSVFMNGSMVRGA